MAIRFLNNLDLTTNEIQNVAAQNLASNPAGYAGQFIFNTTSNSFNVYNGTSWIVLDGSGDISGVTAGAGLSGGGTSGNVTVAVDYDGADNIILAAADGTALTLATTDRVIISDATDSNVKYANLSQLSAAIGGGTVTSVALSAQGDALQITGSPITSSGTLAINFQGDTNDFINGEGDLVLLSTLPQGTVTSVQLAVPSALSVSGGPITSSGTITIEGAGTTSQFIDGTGALQTINVGDITGLTEGSGISITDATGPVPTVAVDYAGADNVILEAQDLSGTAITTGSKILFSDSSSDVSFGNVSDLPFSNNSGTVTSITNAADSGSGTAITGSGTFTYTGGTNVTTSVSGTTVTINTSATTNTGTVTSVAATGANGLTVTGSPITTSGTLAFGISAGGIANDRLANNTISGIALGGSLKTLTATNTSLTFSGSYDAAVARTVALNYAASGGFIDQAADSEGAALDVDSIIIAMADGSTAASKHLVGDLPYSNNSGTVTSIATPAAGGLAGGTITTSGSLSLKNSGSLSGNSLMKWDNGNNQLTNSSVTDDGSTVTIAGNLTVNGTTTTINSTTVSIEDNMMEYANGNDVAGGGANSVDIGFFGNYVISATDYFPTLFYDASSSTSASSPTFRLGNATTKPGNTATIANIGTLIANVEGEITGNAATATKLISARSISATGDAAWSVTFDGSADVTSGLTLATVNSTVGSFGSASNTLTATVNAKGLVTAMAATAISITASQVSDFCTAVEACVGSSHSYAQNIGNNSATSYTVSHNFGTRDVAVQVYDNASPYDTLYLEVQRTSTNALTLISSAAISTNGARCLVTKVA